MSSKKAAKKRADKQKRIEADEARQLKHGPDVPPKVNNFLRNIPVACKPRNDELERALRQVQDVNQSVNGKVADANLIHKPAPTSREQNFFPIIDVEVSTKKEKHGKR